MRNDILATDGTSCGVILRFPTKQEENILEMTYVYDYYHLKIDAGSRTVTSWNNVVHLQPLEFDLLALLIKNMGRALTRDEILDEVWGYDFGGFTRTVDNHISRLRRVLGLKHQIITVSKYGYMLAK